MRSAAARIAVAAVGAGVALIPRAAWAVQSHGGAEGLVAHQLGHVLFTVGLFYVLLGGGAARWSRAGRGAYRAFLVLAIAWNALTFTGHLLGEVVARGPGPGGAGASGVFVARGVWDWLFYLTRLDHLLLVPALVMLFVALLRWWRAGEGAP